MGGPALSIRCDDRNTGLGEVPRDERTQLSGRSGHEDLGLTLGSFRHRENPFVGGASTLSPRRRVAWYARVFKTRSVPRGQGPLSLT